jgi:hypothetical protein
MTQPAATSSIVRHRVASLVAEGRGLEEIEAKVLDPAPVTEDTRAALWLYAWALQELRDQATARRAQPRRMRPARPRPARLTVIHGHRELERLAR